jgi:hypothetical protein
MEMLLHVKLNHYSRPRQRLLGFAVVALRFELWDLSCLI